VHCGGNVLINWCSCYGKNGVLLLKKMLNDYFEVPFSFCQEIMFDVFNCLIK